MNPKSDKQNKLKLTINTLTIRTLEAKATPASSLSANAINGGVCQSCPVGHAQVAAVAYF